MKAFLILIAVAVAVQALTDEQKAKIKIYHKECAEASGVDEALVENARKGEFVEDPKLKAHLLCFSKKAGFQNEAGEIDEGVIRTKLDAELKDLDKTNAVLKECIIRKDAPEDTAYETVKCLRGHAAPGVLGFA